MPSVPPASHTDGPVNPGNGDFQPGVFDRVSAAGARLLRFVPTPVLRVLGTRRNTDGDVLDDDVRASLLSLKVLSSLDIVDVPPVHSRRIVEKEAHLVAGRTRVAEVTDTEIAGVRVRVYLDRPAGEKGPAGAATGQPRPTLVYLHGGGWVTGSLDSHDSTCRDLCAGVGVTVVSVDYRMAPEHPFPAALQDVATVVTALQDGAAVAGTTVDTDRLVVAGDSAGANLAAALCLWLREQRRPQPALQVLAVPATDLSQSHSDPRGSRAEFGEGFYLSEAQMEWYEHHYLGHSSDLPRPVDPTDPLVSPLLAEDLSGLAPAYVAVAGFDPLRDEGEAYAARLQEAGVPVTLRRHRGLVHPFINSVAVWRGARTAMGGMTAHIRTTLGVHG